MPTSVETILKRSSNLIEITAPPDSPPTSNVESNWRQADIYTAVSGYAISDPTGDAELVIEQSIDKEQVDKTDTITPSAPGAATPFEIPIAGDFARARLNVTGSPTSVRVIVYLVRRSSSIANT